MGRNPVSGGVGLAWCQGHGSPNAPTELHSYAQTLVDLLRQAGDFIRNQFDFSFLTRTLPQILGKIYGHLFPHRVRRDAPGTLLAGPLYDCLGSHQSPCWQRGYQQTAFPRAPWGSPTP